VGSIPVANPSPLRHWRLSRRIVPLALLLAAAIAAIVVASALTWPHVPGSGRVLAVGAVDDFEIGTVTHVESDGFFLVRLDDGSFLALHDRATGHLNDPLEWRPEFEFQGTTGWFRSPWHGETYDRYGTLVFGPAARGMDRYRVRFENGVVVVDTRTLFCAPIGEEGPMCADNNTPLPVKP
jgi:nitrite reductase/ring-hydroxylating ferredoxin subunit